MMNNKKLWIALVACVTGAFFLLGFFGQEVYRQAPPVPDRVITESGELLMTGEQILDGQQVWQSIGGQQVGSIWGHGAYQAPDWSADWLHRESMFLLESMSQERHGRPYEEIGAGERTLLEAELRLALRPNTFDAEAGTLIVSDRRAAAMARVGAHYTALFGGAPALAGLREDYALRERSIDDPERLARINDFFFWTSWACITERPGHNYTYTNNWPHDPLLGNHPTTANFVWSILSILLLLAAVGGMVWYHAARTRQEPEPEAPHKDPLLSFPLTPSMRATAKYMGVVLALFAVQVTLGALTAHYTVEGDSFFGLNLAETLPYAVSRTWHIQTGVFWIATAFLGAGLFLAPIIGGREPKFQRLGVNVLFGALLVIVVGSLAGEWLSIHQYLSLDAGFWFGHQGYEYVDLGRFWQIFLFAGLLIWLTLMMRGIWPAFAKENSRRQLIVLFAGSVFAIGLLYGAGLFYGARSNLAVAEYWRWWVVHLWVEGFFEVFATGVMAFLFSALGLVRLRSATRALIASTTIFLIGGIPGTFHHLYFSGTPISITAIGATFSALEVVPLVLIGFEALKTLRMEGRAQWMTKYRWPLRFFVGVCFWNLVGAGLFGFLINPPVALYYMQGLNTTPVHAHTALFGVYGLLSLGLLLFIFRRLTGMRLWRQGSLSYAFWAMNAGLALMVALSLLPVGALQVWESVENGLWSARSAEFLQSPLIERLRWLRIVGDTIFLSGVAALLWFSLGLLTGWSYEPEARPANRKLMEPSVS
jgi:nitric oxide reductase subunit B